jgi:MFS family permease
MGNSYCQKQPSKASAAAYCILGDFMDSRASMPTLFVLLTACAILVASNIYTLVPIYEVIARDLAISSGDVVLAGSLFTIFYAGGLLSLGTLSSFTGLKRILVFGLLSSALTTVCVGLSTGPGSLWVTRSLQGFTLASFASVVFAYSYDLLPFKQRTMLVVLINTGFLIAGIFGQLVSAFLTAWLSWGTVFHFFAVCYFILFSLTYFLLPASPVSQHEREPAWPVFLSLLRNPSLIKCYLVSFTLLFSVIAFYDALGRFYTASETDLFLIRTVGLIGASVSLFTGKLIEIAGEIKTLSAGLAAGAASVSAMAVFPTTAGLIVFSVLFVSSISLAIPTVITLIGSFAGQKRAKALSLYSFILLSGASLAPGIASLFGFTEVLVLLAAIFTGNLGICCLLLKGRPVRPDQLH